MQNSVNNDTTQTPDVPVDTLADILYTLQSQQYESGGLFTIGGQAGTYVIKSPWNTECEYSVLAVSTSSTTDVPFAISSSNPALIAPTTSSSFGLLSQGTETGNPLEGIAGWVSSVSTGAYSTIWIPLGRGAMVYLNTAPGASQVILATIAFRRAYAHIFPTEKVRQLPITARRKPMPNRPPLVVQGLSKQMAGFAAQYPQRKSSRETYEHENVPWTQDPRGATTNVRGQSRSGR